MTTDPTEPPADREMSHVEHPIRCSRCKVADARPGQRYCGPCHNSYMREWRAEQARELANDLAELAEWRAIGGDLAERIDRLAEAVGSHELATIAQRIRRML